MLSHRFDQLSIKKQYRGRPKDKTVSPVGYDTETQKGLCKLLCSPTDYLQPSSFDDILWFLTSHKRQGTVGFFYNLRYDFQALLKWLSPAYWREILDFGKIKYNEYEVTYIPSKMLLIRKRTKKSVKRFVFYDISPFYGRGKLEDVAQKYLGEGKQELSGFDITNLTDTDFYDPVLISYCQKDAKLTEDLAKYWIALCHSQGLYPTTFVSTASISTRYFQSKCNIPTINSFLTRGHINALQIPWLACSGAFITTFKRGRFPSCYEYDINSAYPNTIRNLPDISRGRFKVSKSEIPSDAVLGWLQVKVDLWNKSPGFYFPPLPMLRPHMSNYFPFGSFTTFITLKEYRELETDLNLEFIAGLFWTPTKALVYPFKDAIENIHRIKQSQIVQEDSNPIYYFYKIIMNSFYGKNLQRNLVRDPEKPDYGKYRTGNFFNPCYASYILADTRLSIYRLLKKCQLSDLIASFTDSILLRRAYPEFDEGKDLGQWSAKSEGPLLIIGSGVYTHLTKDGPRTKLRGFHTTSKVDLFKVAKEQYRKKEISLPIKAAITLATALSQGIEENMNYLIEDIRKIALNFDMKRLWIGDFKKVGDYLGKNIDSLPILYNGSTSSP